MNRNFFYQTSTPLRSRYMTNGWQSNKTDRNNVESRSTSPTPDFRQHTGNDVRIITHLRPKTLQPAPCENEYNKYYNVFNSLFIIGEVNYHQKRFQKYFSLSEDLLFDHQPDEYRGNKTIEKCNCCLCKLRFRCDDTEICIKKHPLDEECRNGRELQRNNDMLKYQKRNVCDKCMSSMTLNTKKTKTKYFRCRFHPCAIKLKSISALRQHYLDHLKVKNLICHICEKNYKTKSALKMHERKHL